jgi:hypothetical protein
MAADVPIACSLSGPELREQLILSGPPGTREFLADWLEPSGRAGTES